MAASQKILELNAFDMRRKADLVTPPALTVKGRCRSPSIKTPAPRAQEWMRPAASALSKNRASGAQCAISGMRAASGCGIVYNKAILA